MGGAELRKPLPSECLEALRARFRDRVSTLAPVLQSHGRDESYHAVASPDAVVFPESTAEVVDLAGIASTHRVPLIAFGTGTSLEGHIAALSGGISVDMTR